MAAKRTSELIPLSHSLNLSDVSVDMQVLDEEIVIRTKARARNATGVEMEALMAASVAGLTLYDMLKALSKKMRLDGLDNEEHTPRPQKSPWRAPRFATDREIRRPERRLPSGGEP